MCIIPGGVRTMYVSHLFGYIRRVRWRVVVLAGCFLGWLSVYVFRFVLGDFHGCYVF